MYAKRGYISDGTGVWYKDKLCEQYETKIAKDDDPDSSCRWEEAASIRRRVLPVLKKYADAPKVIVIGHGMMIEAVTGAPHPKCGEIVPFSKKKKKTTTLETAV